MSFEVQRNEARRSHTRYHHGEHLTALNTGQESITLTSYHCKGNLPYEENFVFMEIICTKRKLQASWCCWNPTSNKKKGKHNINWKPLNLQTGSMVGRQVVLTSSHPCYRYHPWLNQKEKRKLHIIYYTTKLHVTDHPLILLYLLSPYNHTLHLHILSILTSPLKTKSKVKASFFLSFSGPEDRQSQAPYLDRYHIHVGCIFAPQDQAIEAGWEHALGPLAASGDGFSRRNDHQHVIVPLNNTHHANSAALLDVPGTAQTAMSMK